MDHLNLDLHSHKPECTLMNIETFWIETLFIALFLHFRESGKSACRQIVFQLWPRQFMVLIINNISAIDTEEENLI